MSSEQEREQLVERILNEALEGYDGAVPPEVVRYVRDLLGIELMSHPQARELVRQALSDAIVDRSGEVAVELGEAPSQKAVSGGGQESD